MSKLISLSVLAVVLLLGSFVEATHSADKHSQLQQEDDLCKKHFQWVSMKGCSSDCSQKEEALYNIDFTKNLLLFNKKISEWEESQKIGRQQDELKIQKRNHRRKENASSNNAHQSAHHDSVRQKEEKERDVSTNQETDNYKNLSMFQLAKCLKRVMELNKELFDKWVEYPTKYAKDDYDDDYEWD